MHHCLLALGCLCLCTIFYVHYTTLMPHGKSICFRAMWHFLCSLQFGSLHTWGSWHMWVLPNKLSFSGFQGFLVQDSIWIYLFFMVTWTYFTLYVGEISILRGTLYCGSNTRWRTSSFFGSLGFFLLLGFCSIATYYFDTGCQFSFNFGLWIGEILAVTFG